MFAHPPPPLRPPVTLFDAPDRTHSFTALHINMEDRLAMLRQMGVFVETEGERQTTLASVRTLLALRPGDPNTRTLHFVRVPADSSLPLEDMEATMYVGLMTHVATRLYFPTSGICGSSYAQTHPVPTCSPRSPYSVRMCVRIVWRM
jgi:hypothetical protein